MNVTAISEFIGRVSVDGEALMGPGRASSSWIERQVGDTGGYATAWHARNAAQEIVAATPAAERMPIAVAQVGESLITASLGSRLDSYERVVSFHPEMRGVVDEAGAFHEVVVTKPLTPQWVADHIDDLVVPTRVIDAGL